MHTVPTCFFLACVTLGADTRAADGVVEVPAVAETDPVPSGDDAADDPAIWVHPTDPSRSLVLGTDKKSGLGVYDLSGDLVQFLACGPINNVDVREGVLHGDRVRDLAAGTRRSDDSIVVFEIDRASGHVREVASFPAGMREVYGLCLSWEPELARAQIIANNKEGRVRQWVVRSLSEASVEVELAREFFVGGQPEGLAADEFHNRLFVGEEGAGVWMYTLDPDAPSTRALIDAVGPVGAHLTADVEGITIAGSPDGEGHVVVSSQGSDRFVAYDRRSLRHAFTFRVVEAPGIDGVTGTDGIDARRVHLGEAFPVGLLVVQDDENPPSNQNFKLVDWRAVLEAAEPARANPHQN